MYRVNKLLKNNNLTYDDIITVLLVGGSTMMPMIKETVEMKFPNSTVIRNDPHLAVAKGAALYAKIKVIENNEFHPIPVPPKPKPPKIYNEQINIKFNDQSRDLNIKLIGEINFDFSDIKERDTISLDINYFSNGFAVIAKHNETGKGKNIEVTHKSIKQTGYNDTEIFSKDINYNKKRNGVEFEK